MEKTSTDRTVGPQVGEGDPAAVGERASDGRRAGRPGRGRRQRETRGHRAGQRPHATGDRLGPGRNFRKGVAALPAG
ncbi:hypothetical protein ACL02O_24095 [Micromonospora sp. MS34]|uniref:hypothetical protein n=1 Tax=Micromonospora sp. MS34 TaxID=3385971 RepID=UPI00399F2639